MFEVRPLSLLVNVVSESQESFCFSCAPWTPSCTLQWTWRQIIQHCKSKLIFLVFFEVFKFCFGRMKRLTGPRKFTFGATWEAWRPLPSSGSTNRTAVPRLGPNRKLWRGWGSGELICRFTMEKNKYLLVLIYLFKGNEVVLSVTFTND